MKILENDIASIEPFGMLDGKPVNLVRTKGGLNMATHVDAKGNESVLAAASHQAILCYTVEQRFPNFQPMIMKSEGMELGIVERHSHFLSNDLRKSGHDIYSVQNSFDSLSSVDFYITKQDMKVVSVNSLIRDNILEYTPTSVPKEYVNAISSAISEKALGSGLKGVRAK